MAQPETPIVQSSLLVVEGRDEQLFFEALLRHEGVRDIQVVPIGGKTKLPANLKALRAAPHFRSVRSLGVVRDADADPGGAFESVCSALRRASLPVPNGPAEPVAGPPRVGVFIIPSGSRAGMLEDLCLAAIADGPAYPCVGKYFACLREAGVEEPRNTSKAQMQVFLASRAEAGKQLGVAAQAGYIPWESPVFDEVKRFLRMLVT